MTSGWFHERTAALAAAQSRFRVPGPKRTARGRSAPEGLVVSSAKPSGFDTHGEGQRVNVGVMEDNSAYENRVIREVDAWIPQNDCAKETR